MEQLQGGGYRLFEVGGKMTSIDLFLGNPNIEFKQKFAEFF